MVIEINLPAVLIAAVLNFGLRMLWFSPVLFGKEWMAEMNVTMEQIKAGKPYLPFAGAFLAGLIAAFVLEIFIQGMDFSGALNGGVIGLLAGIGFVATTIATGFLFEKRSIKLFFIIAGYYVAAYAAMGILLGFMD